MKINEHISVYNVEDLSSIAQGVKQVRAHCEEMESLCEALSNNIEYARENGYDNDETNKAESIIADYVRRLTAAKDEFAELADSVEVFIRKIEDSWNSW